MENTFSSFFLNNKSHLLGALQILFYTLCIYLVLVVTRAVWDLRGVTRDLLPWCTDSLVVVLRLECAGSVVAAGHQSCPAACGILVPGPRIKPTSPE